MNDLHHFNPSAWWIEGIKLMKMSAMPLPPAPSYPTLEGNREDNPCQIIL